MCVAVDHLMASLEARTAEAGLYRRQYDALSSRLDHMEKAHREARTVSRQHAEQEVDPFFQAGCHPSIGLLEPEAAHECGSSSILDSNSQLEFESSCLMHKSNGPLLLPEQRVQEIVARLQPAMPRFSTSSAWFPLRDAVGCMWMQAQVHVCRDPQGLDHRGPVRQPILLSWLTDSQA